MRKKKYKNVSRFVRISIRINFNFNNKEKKNDFFLDMYLFWIRTFPALKVDRQFTTDWQQEVLCCHKNVFENPCI